MKYLLKVFGVKNYDKSISKIGLILGGSASSGEEYWLALYSTDDMTSGADDSGGFGTKITYVDLKDEREAQCWVDERLIKGGGLVEYKAEDSEWFCQKTLLVDSSLECLRMLEALQVVRAKDISKIIATFCVSAATSSLTGETYVVTPGVSDPPICVSTPSAALPEASFCMSPDSPANDQSLDELMDELETLETSELDQAVNFIFTNNSNWGMFQ